MPDNKQDWITDNAFWDSAWEDMQEQLDAQIPQQGSKRRLLWWWWLSMAFFLAFIGWLSWKGLEDSTSPNKAENIPLANIEEVVASTEGRNENTRKIQEEATAIAPNKVLASALPLPTKTPRSPIRSAENKLIESPQVQNILVEKSSTPLTNEISHSNRLDVDPFTSNIQQQALLAPRPSLSPIAKLAQGQSPLLAIVSRQLDKPIEPLSKISSWAWGAEISNTFDWASPYPGTGLSVLASRAIGQRICLLASLGYLHSRESFGESRQQDADSQAPLSPGGMADSLSNEQFRSIFTQEAIRHRSNYIATHRLRLGLGIEQQISSRWGVGAQLGISYLFAGQVPLFVPAVESGDLPLNLNNSGESNLSSITFTNINTFDEYFQQRSAAGNFIGSDEAAAPLRRWDFDLQTRLQYRLSGRLSAFTLAQYSFRPAYDTSPPHFRRWRGQVGLRYMLP